MKFESPNLTSQQIQATTNKLAKPNPPPLHWPPTPPTNRNKTTHLHSTNHTNSCVGEGKKKKQPANHPSQPTIPATTSLAVQALWTASLWTRALSPIPGENDASYRSGLPDPSIEERAKVAKTKNCGFAPAFSTEFASLSPPRVGGF